jgi:ketosteroid isomerase-like protein
MMQSVQGDRVREWVARYERAWRTAGTDGLSALFTDDAVYLRDPYAEPIRGLRAIAEFWEAERDGPDEVFTLTAEVVAEQGDRVWRGSRSCTATCQWVSEPSLREAPTKRSEEVR